MDVRPLFEEMSNHLTERSVMNHQRFCLYIELHSGRFTLKRDGENWVREFPSLLDALQHARNLAVDTDARLTVFDEGGRPIIETFV